MAHTIGRVDRAGIPGTGHRRCFSLGRVVRGAAQCLTTLLLCVALVPTGSAFGDRGHELVAQLATYYLTDDGQALIEDFYGSNYRRLFLADSLYAADVTEQRGNEWRLGFHYTWFSEGDAGFVADQHCPRGQCSVAAVLAARDVLSDQSRSPQSRLDALRFLVHYTADLHDPVNAGFRDDLGGRRVELTDSSLETHTLYEIWQEDLFDHLDHPPFVMANVYARQMQDFDVDQWQNGEPQSWVWETHEAARNTAWPLAEQAGGWNAIYRRDALPVLEEQLQKAAVRLAFLINQVAASDLSLPAGPVVEEPLLDYEPTGR